MYIPSHSAQNDPTILLEVMQRHNFATIISNVNGVPFATHLPMFIRRDGDTFHIEGHFARENPHWQALENDSKALVVFQGPHTYISPALLNNANRVPTWNYIAVHATGSVTINHSAEAKLLMLSKLIAQHEPEYQTQFDAMNTELSNRLVKAIVAFELSVEKLEGKFKLDQHRLADNSPALWSSLEQGNENERGLAEWMKRLGYWPA
ncbi:MAG: FMN-binding negative transcriptional regulator [Burkholderiaceae bacterium]